MGFNGCIFMYGQTTSGKTYSMLGNKSQPGILPCAVRDVFKGIAKSEDPQMFKVQVSYLEIYNETINDLFNKEATNLKITSDEFVSLIFFPHLADRFEILSLYSMV